MRATMLLSAFARDQTLLAPAKYSEHSPTSSVSQCILVPHSLQRLFTHARPSNGAVSNTRKCSATSYCCLLRTRRLLMIVTSAVLLRPAFYPHLCPPSIRSPTCRGVKDSISFFTISVSRPKVTQTDLSQACQRFLATFASI